jgi:hypothetical protein
MNEPFLNQFHESTIFEKKNIKIGLGIALISICVFLISKTFFFIGLFLLLNLGVGFAMRRLSTVELPIGIEVVTLSTVLIGAAYGSLVGAIMGAVGRLIEAFSTKRYFSLVVTVPLYAAMGFVAGMFSSVNIIILGIIISIAFALLSGLFSIAIGGRVSKVVFFGITEIIINILFFINIAPFMFHLMS